jgi:hypothetical protein
MKKIITTLLFVISIVTGSYAKTSPCYNNGVGHKLVHGHDSHRGLIKFSNTPYADHYKTKKHSHK